MSELTLLYLILGFILLPYVCRAILSYASYKKRKAESERLQRLAKDYLKKCE